MARFPEGRGGKLSHAPKAKRGSIAGASPTAKNVAALFMRREEKLSEEQKEYLQRLCASDTALADARRLTHEFAKMVRELEGQKLDRWLKEAAGCEASVMKKFAAGLRKDISAVEAGLTEEWSNGPVEGFVHKLKLVKRQGRSTHRGRDVWLEQNRQEIAKTRASQIRWHLSGNV